MRINVWSLSLLYARFIIYHIFPTKTEFFRINLSKYALTLVTNIDANLNDFSIHGFS